MLKPRTYREKYLLESIEPQRRILSEIFPVLWLLGGLLGGWLLSKARTKEIVPQTVIREAGISEKVFYPSVEKATKKSEGKSEVFEKEMVKILLGETDLSEEEIKKLINPLTEEIKKKEGDPKTEEIVDLAGDDSLSDDEKAEKIKKMAEELDIDLEAEGGQTDGLIISEPKELDTAKEKIEKFANAAKKNDIDVPEELAAAGKDIINAEVQKEGWNFRNRRDRELALIIERTNRILFEEVVEQEETIVDDSGSSDNSGSDNGWSKVDQAASKWTDAAKSDDVDDQISGVLSKLGIKSIEVDDNLLNGSDASNDDDGSNDGDSGSPLVDETEVIVDIVDEINDPEDLDPQQIRDTLQEELDALKQQNVLSKEQIAELEGKLASLETDKAKYQQDFENEKEQLKAELDEWVDELDKALQKNTELAKDAEAYKAKLEEVEKQLAQKLDELKNMESDQKETSKIIAIDKFWKAISYVSKSLKKQKIDASALPPQWDKLDDDQQTNIKDVVRDLNRKGKQGVWQSSIGKSVSSKVSKNSNPKPKKESVRTENAQDQLIFERWNRLAGLIK